jgi:Asp-tRNA(Asn)/Glu-tRNA(Gln) amidotransferase A subunit family amidase
MTDVQRTDLKGSDTGLRPGIPPHGNRFFRTAAIWFLAAFLLAGCAGTPELDGEAAGKFQTRVAAATQFAAQQDFGGAVTELEQLGSEVQAAADQGRLSQERQSRIEASIAKVRADLDAAIAAAKPQPSPTVSEPQEESDGKGKGEDAKREENKDENKGEGKDD